MPEIAKLTTRLTADDSEHARVLQRAEARNDAFAQSAVAAARQINAAFSTAFRSVAREAETSAQRITRAFAPLEKLTPKLNTAAFTRDAARMAQTAAKTGQGIQEALAGASARLDVAPALRGLGTLESAAERAGAGIREDLGNFRPTIQTTGFQRNLAGITAASSAASRELGSALGRFSPQIRAEGVLRPLAQISTAATATGAAFRGIIPARLPVPVTAPAVASLRGVERAADLTGRALRASLVAPVARIDTRGLEVPLRSASTAARRTGETIREALTGLRLNVDAAPALVPLRRLETAAQVSAGRVEDAFSRLKLTLTEAPAVAALGRVQTAATSTAAEVRERLAGLRLSVNVQPAMAGLQNLTRQAAATGREAARALGTLRPSLDLGNVLPRLRALDTATATSANRLRSAFQGLRVSLDIQPAQRVLQAIGALAQNVGQRILGAFQNLALRIDAAPAQRVLGSIETRARAVVAGVREAFGRLRPSIDVGALERLPAAAERIRTAFQRAAPSLDLRGLQSSLSGIVQQSQSAARSVSQAMGRLAQSLSGRFQGRASLDLSGVTGPLSQIGALAARAAQAVRTNLAGLRPSLDPRNALGGLARLRQAAEAAGASARAALSRLRPVLDVAGFDRSLRGLTDSARNAGRTIAQALAGTRINIDASPLQRLTAVGRAIAQQFRNLHLDLDVSRAVQSVQGLAQGATAAGATVRRAFTALNVNLDVSAAQRALQGIGATASTAAGVVRSRFQRIALTVDGSAAERGLSTLAATAQGVSTRVRQALSGIVARLDVGGVLAPLQAATRAAQTAAATVRTALGNLRPRLDAAGILVPLQRIPVAAGEAARGALAALRNLRPSISVEGVTRALGALQSASTATAARMRAGFANIRATIETRTAEASLGNLAARAGEAASRIGRALSGLRPQIDTSSLERIPSIADRVQTAFQRVQQQFSTFRGALTVKTAIDQSGLQAGLGQATQRVQAFRPRAEGVLGIDERPLEQGLAQAGQRLTAFERQFQRTAQKLAELKAPDLASRLQIRFPDASAPQIARLAQMEGELGRIGAAARGARPSLTGLTQSIHDLVSGGALGGIGALITQQVTRPLIDLGRSAINTILEFDGMKRSLVAVMGSAALARTEFAKLGKVAELPGLGLPEAVQASINLQAAGLSADQARTAIVAYGNAVARTGGPNQRVNFASAIEQLGQLQRTGKITAEDLKPIMRVIPELGGVLKRAFGTANLEAIRETGVSVDQFVAITTAGLLKLGPAADSPANAIENLRDKWSKALASLAPVLEPIIAQVTNGLARLVDSATQAFQALPRGAQQGVVVFGALAAAIGPAVVALGVLRAGAVLVGPVFASLAGLGPLLTTGLLAPVNLLAGAFKGIGGAARASVGIAAAAFQGLAPIVQGALAALAGAGRLLVTALVNPIATARAAFGALGGIISGIGPFLAGIGTAAARMFTLLLNPLGLVRAGFGVIAAAIGAINLPLVAAAAAVGLLAAAFATNFQGIRTTTLKVIGGIGKFITAEFQQVRDWFVSRLPQFREAGANIVGSLTTAWKVLAPRITAILRPAWNIISGIIRGAVTGILAIVDVVLNVLTLRWRDAWESLKKVVGAVWQVLVNVVKNGAALIAAVLEPLFAVLAKIPGNVGKAMEGVRAALEQGSKVKLDLDTSSLDTAPDKAKKSGASVSSAFKDAWGFATGWLKNLGIDASAIFKGVGDSAGKSADEIGKQYREAVANIGRELAELRAPNLVAKIKAQFDFKITDQQAQALAKLTQLRDREKQAVEEMQRALETLSGGLKDFSRDLLSSAQQLPAGPLRSATEARARELQARSVSVAQSAQFPLGAGAVGQLNGGTANLQPILSQQFAVQSRAMAQIGERFGRNGCALAVSSILSGSVQGLEGLHEASVQGLVKKLTGLGAQAVAPGQQRPGDVAVFNRGVLGSHAHTGVVAEREGRLGVVHNSTAAGHRLAFDADLMKRASGFLRLNTAAVDAYGKSVQAALPQVTAFGAEQTALANPAIRAREVFSALSQRFFSARRELALLSATTAEGRINVEFLGREFAKTDPLLVRWAKDAASVEEAVRSFQLGKTIENIGTNARREFLVATAATDAQRLALEQLGLSLQSLPQHYQVALERAADFSQQAKAVTGLAEAQRAFFSTLASASPATRAAEIALSQYRTEFERLSPFVQQTIRDTVAWERATARANNVRAQTDAIRDLRLETAKLTATTEFERTALDALRTPIDNYASGLRRLGAEVDQFLSDQREVPRIAQQFNAVLDKAFSGDKFGAFPAAARGITEALLGVQQAGRNAAGTLLNFGKALVTGQFGPLITAMATIGAQFFGMGRAAQIALPQFTGLENAARDLGAALQSGSEERVSEMLAKARVAVGALGAEFLKTNPVAAEFNTSLDEVQAVLDRLAKGRINAIAASYQRLRQAVADSTADFQKSAAQAQIEARTASVTQRAITGLSQSYLAAGGSLDLLIQRQLEGDRTLRALREQVALTAVTFDVFQDKVPKAVQAFVTSAFGLGPVLQGLAAARVNAEDFGRTQQILSSVTDAQTQALRRAQEGIAEYGASFQSAVSGVGIFEKALQMLGTRANGLDEAGRRVVQTFGESWFTNELTGRVRSAREAMEAATGTVSRQTQILREMGLEWGKLTAEQQAFATKNINQILRFDKIAEFAQGVKGVFNQAFSDLYQNGFRGFFNSVVQGFNQMLAQMAADYLSSELSKLFVRGLGSIFGGGFDKLLGGLAGARAAGGPVSAGRAYLVGEQQPEVFVPRQSGSILNQQQLVAALAGAGGAQQPAVINISLNVNAQDAGSFRRSAGQLAGEVGTHIEREMKRRGRW